MSSKFARKLYDNLPSLDLAVQIWWHNNLSCPNSKKHLNVSVKKRKWFQDINIYNSMVFTMMSLIYGPALTRVQFILCFPSLFGILISNAISAFHCSLPLYENELLITLYLCLEINKYELSVLLLLQWTCCCWLGCCWSLRRGEVGILWQRWRPAGYHEDDQRVFLESIDDSSLCCWQPLSALLIPLLQASCNVLGHVSNRLWVRKKISNYGEQKKVKPVIAD